MLTACGLTHVGHVRKINEDSLLCDLDLGLFVVADGMGGHNAGEVASRLAVDTIRGFLEQSRGNREPTWPFGVHVNQSFDANCLMTALKIANRCVLETADARTECLGMGTTVVAGLIHDARFTYASVGDSRIYSFLNGRLERLTRDDSWVTDMMERDATLDVASLESHPLRHVLTSVIGVTNDVDVTIVERPLAENELLLMSSDGLHGCVEESAIVDTLRTGASLESIAAGLIARALDRGGKDNVTALLVRNGDASRSH